MILGAYSHERGGGGETLPRIVQVAIAPMSSRTFSVTIHEEGTGLTYRQSVVLERAAEARLLQLVADLHGWSVGLMLTAASARKAVDELGRTLQRAFLGRKGGALLAALEPTALLIDVDERILGLPWELLRSVEGELALDVPVGRIVGTATVPRARRDPVAEDPTVEILAVVNPTDDLAATEAELAVLRDLAAGGAGVTVRLDVLEGAAATRRGFAAAVRDRAYDIVHVAGHASFDGGDPHDSSLLLADGPFTATAVGRLAWSKPPYLVVNSACESARTAQGKRLVASGGRVNGLPAAFLAAGCAAYIGHFWPVGDRAAATFAAAFYETLFGEVDIGSAMFAARQAVRPDFDSAVDLAALGAVLFGDAGTADAARQSLAKAV